MIEENILQPVAMSLHEKHFSFEHGKEATARKLLFLGLH